MKDGDRDSSDDQQRQKDNVRSTSTIKRRDFPREETETDSDSSTLGDSNYGNKDDLKKASYESTLSASNSLTWHPTSNNFASTPNSNTVSSFVSEVVPAESKNDHFKTSLNNNDPASNENISTQSQGLPAKTRSFSVDHQASSTLQQQHQQHHLNLLNQRKAKAISQQHSRSSSVNSGRGATVAGSFASIQHAFADDSGFSEGRARKRSFSVDPFSLEEHFQQESTNFAGPNGLKASGSSASNYGLPGNDEKGFFVCSCFTCCKNASFPIFNVFRGENDWNRIKILFYLISFSAFMLLPSFLLEKYGKVGRKWGSTTPFYWFLFFSLFFTGFVVFEMILSTILYLLLHIPRISDSNILYWAREYGRILSYFLWVITTLIFFEIAKDNPKGGTSSLLLGIVPEDIIRHFYSSFLLLIVFLLCFLAKNYMITSMAINFNARNYVDRIKDVLLCDQILKSMEKAKSSYKSRKRAQRIQTTFGLRGFTSRASSMSLSVPTGLFPANSSTERLATTRPRSSVALNDEMMQSSTNLLSSNPVVIPVIPEDDGDSDISLRCSSGISPLSLPFQDMSATQLLNIFLDLISRDNAIYDPSKADCRREIFKFSRYHSRRLFKWIKDREASHVTSRDLSFYFEECDVPQVMSLLSIPHKDCGKVTEIDFENFLVRLYRERHRISRNLLSMRFAVSRVDQMATSLLVSIFFLIAFFIILRVDLKDVQSLLSVLILGLSFIFGNSVKNCFDSILFVFSVHPYDIGDRVYLPIHESADSFHNLVVHEIKLLTTIFERNDGIRVSIPNSVLAGKMILNLRRSGFIAENFYIYLDFDTSINDIGLLRDRFLAFLRSNPDDFTEVMAFEVNGLAENQIKIKLKFQHRSNFQDMMNVHRRRDMIWCFIVQSMKDLGIKYMLDPVYRIQHFDDEDGKKADTDLDSAAKKQPFLFNRR